MADYPDWTRLIQLIGSNIMLPIDIQASYVMIPVDIQAQYVTLDIDIVAQTVGNITVDIAAQTIGNIDINLAASDITLDINIAASDITLNVDITAQTIGNLTIYVEAQSVGIYLKADWEVLQGTDYNIDGSATCNDGVLTSVVSQQATAGKTFYVCQWGFNIEANSGVKGVLYYHHNASDTVLAENGGMIGAAQSLTKPIAVEAGDYIRINLQQWSGSNVDGHASIGGYEI